MNTQKTRIFFTTNAGLYFSSGRGEILIDGIHDAAAVGFSAMSGEMERQMKSKDGLFVGTGTLLFTHLHKDHYNASKVRAYLRRHPETGLWGPGLVPFLRPRIREDGDAARFQCGGFSVTAFVTRHSGGNFAHIPHRSYLLRNESAGEAFLASGDAVFDPGLAQKILAETGGCPEKITIFVTLYQLVEEPSRDFITALDPGRVILIHQPRPGDPAAESVAGLTRMARENPPGGRLVEEAEPMSWIG